jgi:hypothetical protein
MTSLKPTPLESINKMIVSQFEAIYNAIDINQWIKHYSSTCDTIIQGMFNRKSTEIHWLNDLQKQAWFDIPSDLKSGLIETIRNCYDSGVYVSPPRECKYILRQNESTIPKREKLIVALRKYRDNEDALEVCHFAFEATEAEWISASFETKSRVKTCWLELAKITLDLDKTVLYMKNSSPLYWQKLTKEWIIEANIL